MKWALLYLAAAVAGLCLGRYGLAPPAVPQQSQPALVKESPAVNASPAAKLVAAEAAATAEQLLTALHRCLSLEDRLELLRSLTDQQLQLLLQSSLSLGSDNEDALLVILALGERDWQQAYELALKQPEMARDHLLAMLLGGLAATDPARALRLFSTHQLKVRLQGRFFSCWVQRDAESAFRWANTQPPAEAGRLWSDLAIFTNPGQATHFMQLAETLKDPKMKSAALSQINAIRAMHDPEAALRFQLQQPDPADGQDSLGGTYMAFEQIARQAPQAAISLVQSARAGKARDAATTALVSILVRNGELGVLQSWLQAQQDPQVLKALANRTWDLPANPEALHRLAALLPTQEQKKSFHEQAVSVLVRARDYEQAAKFVALSGSGLQGLAESFYRDAPNEAIAWAQSMTGAQRDKALLGVIEAMAQAEPAQATQWLPQITDYELRKAAMREIANRWRNVDRTALGHWLDQQPGMNPILRAEMLWQVPHHSR